MRVITITGYKGGIGKSTTAVHLATYFSDFGKTILVDGDPNRSCESWLANATTEPNFLLINEDELTPNLSADYMIIDTASRPSSDDLEMLCQSSDLMILPTMPDVLSVEPLLAVTRDIANTPFVVLITAALPFPNTEAQALRKEFLAAGMPVFSTMIRRTVGFPRAASEGVCIRDLKDSLKRIAWYDYERVGSEVMETLNQLSQQAA